MEELSPAGLLLDLAGGTAGLEMRSGLGEELAAGLGRRIIRLLIRIWFRLELYRMV